MNAQPEDKTEKLTSGQRRLIELAFMPFMLIYQGWWLSILFDWFLYPLIEIPIYPAQAAGLLLISRLMTFRPMTTADVSLMTTIWLGVIIPPVVVFVGYLIRCAAAWGFIL